MYERLDGRGAVNSSFVTGMNSFIQFACSQQNRMSGDKIRCPCKKCHNTKYMDLETIKYHLFWSEFVKDYSFWKHQGEKDMICEISYDNDLLSGAQPDLEYDNPY